jgi:thiol-disulfide isomerase/thioredoxin
MSTSRKRGRIHDDRDVRHMLAFLPFLAIVVIWCVMASMTATNAQRMAIDDAYNVRAEATQVSSLVSETRASSVVNVYLFWGDGCRHCKALMRELREFKSRHPGIVRVIGMETWQDSKNANVRDAIEKEIGTGSDNVPLLMIGNRVYQGYDESKPNFSDMERDIMAEYRKPTRDGENYGLRLISDAIADAKSDAKDK